MASSDDDIMNSEPEQDDDNLFGDEEDDEEPKAQKPRELSDDELDSGDDENRDDRARKSANDLLGEDTTRDVRISEQAVWRHPLPKPSDDEVSSSLMLEDSADPNPSSMLYDCLSSLV